MYDSFLPLRQGRERGIPFRIRRVAISRYFSLIHAPPDLFGFRLSPILSRLLLDRLSSRLSQTRAAKSPRNRCEMPAKPTKRPAAYCPCRSRGLSPPLLSFRCIPLRSVPFRSVPFHSVVGARSPLAALSSRSSLFPLCLPGLRGSPRLSSSPRPRPRPALYNKLFHKLRAINA